MTRYWPTADPIDQRIIEALPDFDGWRTEQRPPPKYEPWPDEPITSERRGKMLAEYRGLVDSEGRRTRRREPKPGTV